MSRFDVCNGEADGLCSVLQWRLHQPGAATLITGFKREIESLSGVDAAPLGFALAFADNRWEAAC